MPNPTVIYSKGPGQKRLSPHDVARQRSAANKPATAARRGTTGPSAASTPSVSSPSPSVQASPAPIIDALDGDVFGAPGGNTIKAIDAQLINGPLTTGQTYICDATGTLQPVIPVSPFSGTPDVGDTITWDGANWVPTDPVSTSAAFNSPAYTTDQALDGTVPFAAFDATVANRTATLPAVSTYTGPALTIAKSDSGGHSVTFGTTGGDTVVGGIGPIASQYGTWTVVKFSSTKWITVERQGT